MKFPWPPQRKVNERFDKIVQIRDANSEVCPKAWHDNDHLLSHQNYLFSKKRKKEKQTLDQQKKDNTYWTKGIDRVFDIDAFVNVVCEYHAWAVV